MVIIDPNTGLYQKDMFVEDGVVHIFTPDKTNVVFRKDRVYIGELPPLSKVELQALVENLQQILACGMLDD